MQKASAIECENQGWFIMKFKCRWFGGESTYTSSFARYQSRVINLRDLGLAEGDEVWPVVNITWGLGNFECSMHIQYDPAAGTATYKIGGTTLNPTCDLVEGGSES